MRQARATGPIDPKRLSGEPPWAEVLKKADESVSASTTLQNDDELTFASVSGVVYEFEFVIIYASPAGGGTPDIKVAMGEDATARGIWTYLNLSTSDTASGQARALILDSGSAINGGTATGKRLYRGSGWYVSAGSPFKIQWAQNTSDANPTIVYAGSYLRYRAIA